MTGATCIYSSVAPTYQQQIHEDHLAHNIRAMWIKMLAFDNTKDVQAEHATRWEFQTTMLDPTKSSLIEYIHVLEGFRGKLAGTEKPLQDADIRNQLLFGLPQTPNWAQAKSYCLDNKDTLQATITYLRERELPANQFDSPYTLTADTNESRGRINNRGRGRGRGKARGNKFDRSASRASRESSNSNKVEKSSGSVYYFYKNKGYKEYKYKIKKKFQEQYLAGKSEGGGSGSDNKAHISLADPQFETDYHYTESHIGEGAMIAHNFDRAWILDSGASRHFTGDYRDLQQLQKWEQPRNVTTADGKAVHAIGCGTAQLGAIILKDI